MLCGGHQVERCPVDQFEWPGPHPQDDTVTSQLIAPADNGVQPDVREGAADVRVNLYDSQYRPLPDRPQRSLLQPRLVCTACWLCR